MDFNEYQALAKTTAKPTAMNLTYLLGGLAVEASEGLDKYCKAIRDNDGELSEDLVRLILKEAGDCLWFVALIAEYFNVDMNELAEANLAKLLDRKERGVIGGSGDER